MSPRQQRKTKNRVSKKPAQLKKNDNHATQNVKVQKGATEGMGVAGPVLTRAQAKQSYKIHLLKVKKAMSSVNKSTIEDLQKKAEEGFYSEKMLLSSRKNDYQRELCWIVLNGLLYRKHQEMSRDVVYLNQSVDTKGLGQQLMSLNPESAFSGHLRAK